MTEKESKFTRVSHYLQKENHWESIFLLRDEH